METLIDNKSDDFKFLTSFFWILESDQQKRKQALQWRMNPFCAVSLFVHPLKIS